MRLIRQSVELLPHLHYDDMLAIVSGAGSICYKTTLGTDREYRENYIGLLIKKRHLSVLEHVGFSVHIICDRGVSHELVRHRLASYTQESTRYCNYTGTKFGSSVTFVMPPFMPDWLAAGEYEDMELKDRFAIRSMPTGLPFAFSTCPNQQMVEAWLLGKLEAERSYFRSASAGLPTEYTRGDLSNAVKTELVMTANMREWRHIFSLRLFGVTGWPHPQMQEVMQMIYNKAIEQFPIFFEGVEKDA